jgi:serine/threonine protein kinase
MKHPNIISMNQASIENLNYSMPYFSLGSLGDFLKEMPQHFNIFFTLKVAIDLFAALEYLHSIDIIHRNIKPNNLMVRQSDLKLISVRSNRTTGRMLCWSWGILELLVFSPII